MFSLTTRLLIAGSIVLTAFLGVTGYTLDHAFRDRAEQSLQERLQAHALGLIASAELRDNGQLYILDTLPEARYSRPNSGLYAQITRYDGQHRWRSISLAPLGVELISGAAPRHTAKSCTPSRSASPSVSARRPPRATPSRSRKTWQIITSRSPTSVKPCGACSAVSRCCCSPCRGRSCAGASRRCAAPRRTKPPARAASSGKWNAATRANSAASPTISTRCSRASASISSVTATP